MHNNAENFRQLEKSRLNVSSAADKTSTQEEGKGGWIYGAKKSDSGLEKART